MGGPRGVKKQPRERINELMAGIYYRIKAVRCALAMLFGVAIAVLSSQAEADISQPFASHGFSYTGVSIRPNHVDQATLDQAVRDFYDAWKSRYLEAGCGSGRFYISADVDKNNLTVSEAHGYGMILTVLMAGHDPEAQTLFDGLYAYFRDHPSSTHENLMSWYQDESCRDVEGSDSAADGDLDIAFALLLADRQWGSCGSIDYLGEARKVIADIQDGDLDRRGLYVLLGDWVTTSDSEYYASTRTSDFMPDHFRSFAASTGNGSWTELLDQTYRLIEELQTDHSPGTGLLPDFVIDPLGTPEPAWPGFLEGDHDGDYDYNACRDPWRLATDFLVSSDGRARAAVQRINTWIRAETRENPAAIKSGYGLDGSSSPGADYLSMAFVAPLGVAAMVDPRNQDWLNSIWDLVVSTPISAEAYYENTLKLLSMIVMSGNWWASESVPEVGSGECTTSEPPQAPDSAACSATLSGAKIVLRRLGGSTGDESLRFKGTLFFPSGVPDSDSLLSGAELLIEDLGSGGAAIFKLTRETNPIPGATQGACNPDRDGWRSRRRRVEYRNQSTAIDPPACTQASARGLSRLVYRPRNQVELAFSIKTRNSTLSTPVGPLRATLVIGSADAPVEPSRCGISAPLVCSGKGSTQRCR